MTSPKRPHRIRSEVIRFWVLPAEHTLFADIAKRNGVTVSRWARQVLTNAARIEARGW